MQVSMGCVGVWCRGPKHVRRLAVDQKEVPGGPNIYHTAGFPLPVWFTLRTKGISLLTQ